MGLGVGNSAAMRVIGVLGCLCWRTVAVERARMPAPMTRISGDCVEVAMVVRGISVPFSFCLSHCRDGSIDAS